MRYSVVCAVLAAVMFFSIPSLRAQEYPTRFFNENTVLLARVNLGAITAQNTKVSMKLPISDSLQIPTLFICRLERLSDYLLLADILSPS